MNDKEILKILKEKPFILQKLFGGNDLKKQVDYDKRYFWGTITEDEVNKIVAWLNDEELEDAVIIPRATLQHWFELLCVNGCNSKGMVRNDIKEVLKK
ncbi:MAG: hypothetical protein K6G28_02025 [Acholeplasmatales bacterium]|nr:hypothetical protein [Acholeplasmatales bacterium]